MSDNSFTITAEILTRSLVNIYQLTISGQIHEIVIYGMCQRARANLMSVFNASCPVIDNEFRHNDYDEINDQ